MKYNIKISRSHVFGLLVFHVLMVTFFLVNISFSGSGAERFLLSDKLQVTIFYYLLVAIIATAAFLLSNVIHKPLVAHFLFFNVLCILGYFVYLKVGVNALKPLVLEMQGSLTPDVLTLEEGHPENDAIYKVGLLSFSDAIAARLHNAYLGISLLVGNIFIFLESRVKKRKLQPS